MKMSHASHKPSHRAAPAAEVHAAPDGPLGPEPAGQMPTPAERERVIRELAYSFFEERGRVDGHELDDWLRAEAEVIQIEQQSRAGRPGSGAASPSQTEVHASHPRH